MFLTETFRQLEELHPVNQLFILAVQITIVYKHTAQAYTGISIGRCDKSMGRVVELKV